MPSQSTAAQRRKELAVIHIAKADLGLDDALYRDLLEEWTGKRSSAKLNAKERHAVIDAFKKMGFETQSDRDERLSVADDDKDQVKKIKVLWLKLHDVGAVTNPSKESLNAFVSRVTDVASVDWLTPEQANTVIEALKSWLARQ
mgnify:CR=1 FL=1